MSIEILEKKYKHSQFLNEAVYYPNNDDATGQITVKLKNGKSYDYYNVPIDVWDALSDEKIANKIFRNILNQYTQNKENHKIYIDTDLEDLYTEISIMELLQIFNHYWNKIYYLISKNNVKKMQSVYIAEKVSFSFRKGFTKIKRNKLYQLSLFVIDEIGCSNIIDIFAEQSLGRYRFTFKLNQKIIDNLIIDKINIVDDIKNKIINVMKKDV